MVSNPVPCHISMLIVAYKNLQPAMGGDFAIV